MGPLTFACPDTGKPIPTGIETDHRTLAAACGVGMRIRCPHCAREHEFAVAEGHVVEAA